MKKFLQLTTAAAIAAAALTACSPPGEVPSDKKVRTATDVEAPAKPATSAEAKADAKEVGVPKFIDCAGKPGALPASFSLDCTGNKDKLTGITWSKVTQTRATGTGTRVTVGEDGKETTTANVPVVLSEPINQSDGTVFSTVTVDGSVIALG